MAKSGNKTLIGTRQYVCSACDAGTKSKGYGVTNLRKGEPLKCAYCGSPKIIIEPKDHRFKRVATNKTRKLLEEINRLGRMASTNYQWDIDDVNTMFKALHDALDTQHEKFQKIPASIRADFTL